MASTFDSDMEASGREACLSVHESTEFLFRLSQMFAVPGACGPIIQFAPIPNIDWIQCPPTIFRPCTQPPGA